MNVEELAEYAVELKTKHGHNCSQAVAVALSSETNLSEDTLRAITAGFGGGMGTMEATCGSLIGAGIIAGLKTDGKGTIKLNSQILKRFCELSGAVTCKEIKGRDTGVALCPCDQCVRNAVRAYYLGVRM
mgnify:FL=1